MYIVFDEAKLKSLLLTTAFYYDRSPSYNVTINEVFLLVLPVQVVIYLILCRICKSK